MVGTATVLFLSAFAAFNRHSAGTGLLAAGILILAVARTAVDYRMSWPFYAAVDEDDERATKVGLIAHVEPSTEVA
jgi:hypothetical protein